MPKIIVGIQAFNAERTLRRAVDSMLLQTFDDFVLIIYDNGSTDSTQEIMYQYKRIDPRVKCIAVLKNDPLIIHKEMPRILREYVDAVFFAYLDADDEYLPMFLEKTINFAEENRLDIATTGSNFIAEESEETIRVHVADETLIISREEFAEQFINYRKFHWALWGKLFRITNEVKELSDFMPESVKNNYILSDMEMNLVLLQEAKRIGVMNETLHNYYQTNESLSRQHRPNLLKNHEFIFELMYRFLQQFGEVSKQNLDYLYAIWLGFMLEEVNRLLSSSYRLEVIQQFAIDILTHPITERMISCNPDSSFTNLRNRKDFPKWLTDKVGL